MNAIIGVSARMFCGASFLRDMSIIQVDETFESCLERVGGVEAGGAQDAAMGPFEASDHAVGLWSTGGSGGVQCGGRRRPDRRG